jgi:hypothetical protein
MNIFDTFFRNPNYTEFAQLVSAFVLGLVFSPFSFGVIYFVAFIIVYEIAYAYFSRLERPYWRLEGRIGIEAAAIAGFIIGRILVGFDDPLRDSSSSSNTEGKKLSYREKLSSSNPSIKSITTISWRD